MLEQSDYILDRGEVCPHCLSTAVQETGRRDHSPGKICREKRCEDCSFRWWDIYALTAYDPIDLRDDPF